MATSDTSLPTRLVICVDGTQGGGDTYTNISRLYAGIKRGLCTDKSSGRIYNQVARYVPGIGLADNIFSTDRIQANVLGQGHLKQVQDVYESCCQLTNSNDEVWLFGFSRGAYVVRAVAGLLHSNNSLASAGQPEFARDFKRLLKKADGRSGEEGLTLSPVSACASPLFNTH